MADKLSNLNIVVRDDERIIAPAKWMPRIELTCGDKHCLLLGGHCAASNSIMVWCTCDESDAAHPDGSRLLALDSWVVEHCRGEALDGFEFEDEEEDEAHEGYDSRLDRLCMEMAMVVRAGPNVLPKQIPLRQLLSTTLVAQGGNKALKGVSFWVYWYDQPIPTSESKEHKRLRATWAAGPLTERDTGVWYRAKIIKCNTTSGLVEVEYDFDKTREKIYLLVAFAHFDLEPPSPGARPDVLPDMDMIKYLGLPPGAAAGKASAAPKSHEVPDQLGGGKVATIISTKLTPESHEKVAPASAPPPPHVPAAAAAAAAVGSKTSAAAPAGVKSKPKPVDAAASAPADEPLLPAADKPRKVKLPPAVKRKSLQPAQPSAAARPPKKPPVAPAAGTGSRSGPSPAARPSHDFDWVPLAASNTGPAAPAWRGTLGPDAWVRVVQAARSRPGFRGLLCGRQEQAPVFVFNEVDDASVPAFTYLSVTDFEGRLGADLAAAVREQPALAGAMEYMRELCEAVKPRWDMPCGLSFHKAVRQREVEEAAAGRAAPALAGVLPPEFSYGKDGRLLATRPLGVHECGSRCSGEACRSNMQISRGLQRPLEAFRTRDARWGLRCSEPLNPGEPVAPLLGRLAGTQRLADDVAAVGPGSVAASQLPAAPGVVLLNHFFRLWEAVFSRGLNWSERHVRLWQLPPNPFSHALCSGGGTGRSVDDGDGTRPPASMLAIDTRGAGNVARFVRHWTPEADDGGLGPALVAQAVLAGGCRTPLLYYIGLFAARRVEALEELSCDFSSMSLDGEGPGAWKGKGATTAVARTQECAQPGC